MSVHLVRAVDAVPYGPPGHHGITAHRLQGGEASGSERVWVSVSTFEPGAVVDPAPVVADTVYVLLTGRLALDVEENGDQRQVTLGPHDSIHLAAGVQRSVRNDSTEQATLLVIIAPLSGDDR